MKHVLHVSETVDVLELGPCECYERSSENWLINDVGIVPDIRFAAKWLYENEYILAFSCECWLENVR